MANPLFSVISKNFTYLIPPTQKRQAGNARGVIFVAAEEMWEVPLTILIILIEKDKPNIYILDDEIWK